MYTPQAMETATDKIKHKYLPLNQSVTRSFSSAEINRLSTGELYPSLGYKIQIMRDTVGYRNPTLYWTIYQLLLTVWHCLSAVYWIETIALEGICIVCYVQSAVIKFCGNWATKWHSFKPLVSLWWILNKSAKKWDRIHQVFLIKIMISDYTIDCKTNSPPQAL